MYIKEVTHILLKSMRARMALALVFYIGFIIDSIKAISSLDR